MKLDESPNGPRAATGRCALRLHGYAVSNYYNIVHAALLEKHATFELIHVRASQEEAFLARSAMGKIPVLQTPSGWLAETVAILEYLEDTIVSPALYPSDPYARARGRQIVNVTQMYVEAQIRLLFPGVFFGGSNPESQLTAVRQMLDRSTRALRRLMAAAPFVLGAELSYADLFLFYCFDIADRVTRFVYSRCILAEIGCVDWFDMMSERPSTQLVMADFYSVFPAYLSDHKAAYDLLRETGRWRPAVAVAHD